MRSRAGQVLRYLLVGVLSLAVDLGLLTVLYRWFGVALPIAAAVAFLSAFAVNFSMSQRWTFRVADRTWSQLVRYTCLVIANTVATAILVDRLAAIGLHFVAAKLITTAVLVVVNFLVLRAWVFPASQRPPDGTARGSFRA